MRYGFCRRRGFNHDNRFNFFFDFFNRRCRGHSIRSVHFRCIGFYCGRFIRFLFSGFRRRCFGDFLFFSRFRFIGRFRAFFRRRFRRRRFVFGGRVFRQCRRKRVFFRQCVFFGGLVVVCNRQIVGQLRRNGYVDRFLLLFLFAVAFGFVQPRKFLRRDEFDVAFFIRFANFRLFVFFVQSRRQRFAAVRQPIRVPFFQIGRVVVARISRRLSQVHLHFPDFVVRQPLRL